MILTLQSGAALARSSNLIGASSEASATDADGTRCLDTTYTTSAGNKVDLGEPANADINLIPNVEFRTEANEGTTSQVVTKEEVCRGGLYYFHNGEEWVAVEYPQGGMLVSAIALSSFSADSIRYTDISRM
jgi:hypothetical protein